MCKWTVVQCLVYKYNITTKPTIPTSGLKVYCWTGHFKSTVPIKLDKGVSTFYCLQK